MPEEALLDAPVDGAIDDGAQIDDSGAQADDSTSQDGGAQDAQSQQSQDDSAPVIADANGQLKLSEKARAELDRIKAENPRLAREMRAALFDRQTLLSKVPGGVKEALATIEAYEAEGGSEAVQQVKEELGQWRDLDRDFMEGKPEFVAKIATNNPDGFVKAAPHVMAKFAEMAPANFTHEISKVFAQDMAASDVPLNLKLLRREIEDPANPGKVKAGMGPIADIYNALQSYADRITGYAKNAPKQEQQKPAGDAGAPSSDIEQRELQQVQREFGWEGDRIKESITESEFKLNLGNRKPTETQVSAIRELYETRLQKLIGTIPKHKENVDKFVAAKDKAGYQKHMRAAYAAKAKIAMDQAFKAIMPGKPGPAAKPADKPAIPGAKPADTTGWTRVAVKPAKDTIAHWKMSGKMLKEGKYILRDGKQVIYNGR